MEAVGAAVRELSGWDLTSAGELARLATSQGLLDVAAPPRSAGALEEAGAGWGVGSEGGVQEVPAGGGAGEEVRAAAESAGGASSSPASPPASPASPAPDAPRGERTPPPRARGETPDVLLSEDAGPSPSAALPAPEDRSPDPASASGEGREEGEVREDAASGEGRDAASGDGRDLVNRLRASGDGREEELVRVLEALLDAHLAVHALSQVDPAPCTLHPAPCALHPAPCTMHPAPCTLHPAPWLHALV